MAKNNSQKIDQKNTKTVKSTITTASLHTWNKWLAVIYAVQGVAILLLSTSKTFPLTTNYLVVDPLASEAAGSDVLAQATRNLADVNIAYLLAAFLLISAVVHASAAWWCRKFYESDVSKNVNRIRWYTLAAVGGLMFVTLAMLSGATDLSLLLMIVALGVSASLAGFSLESANQSKSATSKVLCWLGGVAALAPWIVIVKYLGGSVLYDGAAPAYVFWAAASLFVVFAGLLVSFKLQLKKHGKWNNYLYSERAYIVLALVAQTALAWQVYFGALQA